MVQACPGCGYGRYANLDNRSYATHCRYFSSVIYQADGDSTQPIAEHINNINSNNNGYSNPPIMQVEIDSAGNPINCRGLFQAHIK